MTAPPSKSMAHRLLICAGLSEGESEIKNIAFSEDVLATLDCLEEMGARIEKRENSVKIKGISPFAIKEGKVFSARESGSTLRFLIPIVLLSGKRHTFNGYGRLMERPLEIYESICKEKGFYFLREKGKITLEGRLTSDEYTLRGDISSQFISGLLFALCLCKGDSRIRLTGKIESRSYIDMTLWAMKGFGVNVLWENESTLYIKGGQSYRAGCFTNEGDYSNAAFFDALSCLGYAVKVEGLKKSSLQGDRIYKEYYKELKKGKAVLDVSDCPDLAPVLMTLACFLEGAELTGTARLKIKESDRGLAMQKELSKLGADIKVFENKIIINKSALHKSEEAFFGHNDHRIVMALSIAGVLFGGEIEDAQAVKKSYPDFFERLRELGVEVRINDD